jgi:hypothetical protein
MYGRRKFERAIYWSQNRWWTIEYEKNIHTKHQRVVQKRIAQQVYIHIFLNSAHGIELLIWGDASCMTIIAYKKTSCPRRERAQYSQDILGESDLTNKISPWERKMIHERLIKSQKR